MYSYRTMHGLFSIYEYILGVTWIWNN